MSNQWAGVPSVDDLISIYCRCRGIPSALPQLNFYLALSVFKMAGIAQVCTHAYTRFYWNCITVCFIYFYLLMSNDGLAGLGQIILNVIMLSLPVQLQYLITLKFLIFCNLITQSRLHGICSYPNHVDKYCLLNYRGTHVVSNLIFIPFVYCHSQGIYARHLLGNASSPNAAEFSQCVEPLAKIALLLAQRWVAVAAFRVTKEQTCGCF